jgi:L-serine/L-threonine ammonia-lyase
VSPYDDPLLWAGHSSLVDELALGLQSSDAGTVPSHVVVSVGGGGLLCGVLEGLARQPNPQWAQATVVASETDGAASFHGAWGAAGGPDYSFKLSGISSVATSLGALQVTPAALHRAAAHRGRVASCTCTDAEAVAACAHFADDHKLLVEPACGAALAVAYSARLRAHTLRGATCVVLQVCGGR